jgi:hypothetical protein
MMAKQKKQKAEPQPQPEPRKRTFLIYIGRRRNAKRLSHAYLSTDESWKETKEWPWFTNINWQTVIIYEKKFTFARPGTVISVEYKDDDKGTVYGATAKVVGHIDDTAAATWTAASKAAETEWTLQKNAKKEGARDTEMELLRPLRVAYGRLRTTDQRTAFLARVIAGVTKHERG